VAHAANITRTCGFLTVLAGMRSFTLVEELEMVGDGLQMTSWLGRAHPLIGSDSGPVLAMNFSPAEITRLFPARNTPQEQERFLRHVRRAVRDDVLSMQGFDGAGIQSISAPVRDSSGSVVAAACIVGTTDYIASNAVAFEKVVRELAAGATALLA